MKKKPEPKETQHRFGHFKIPKNTKVVSFSVKAEEEYGRVPCDEESVRKDDTRIRLTQ